MAVKDLQTLLQSMNPKLIKGDFVFCSITEDQLSKLKNKPILVFRESEGITVILNKKEADDTHLLYNGVWAMITLTIHSDLSAVGFLAAISNKLAERGISVNVVSAYYHDHLFVPIERSEETLELLKELAVSAYA